MCVICSFSSFYDGPKPRTSSPMHNTQISLMHSIWNKCLKMISLGFRINGEVCFSFFKNKSIWQSTIHFIRSPWISIEIPPPLCVYVLSSFPYQIFPRNDNYYSAANTLSHLSSSQLQPRICLSSLFSRWDDYQV